MITNKDYEYASRVLAGQGPSELTTDEWKKLGIHIAMFITEMITLFTTVKVFRFWSMGKAALRHVKIIVDIIKSRDGSKIPEKVSEV